MKHASKVALPKPVAFTCPDMVTESQVLLSQVAVIGLFKQPPAFSDSLTRPIAENFVTGAV